jgi:hypothetical protein
MEAVMAIELLVDWPLSEERQALLRRSAAYRRTILYLRPNNDAASGLRFQDLFFHFLGSTFQVIALADSWSNPISIGESVMTLIGLTCLWTFAAILFDPHSRFPWLSEILPLVATALFTLSTTWRRFLSSRRVRTTSARDLAGRALPSLSVVRYRVPQAEDWQPLVLQLAAVCHALLIDVSRPGGRGLLWELQTLPALFPSRILLIADEAQFTEWFDERSTAEASDAAPQVIIEMRQALESCKVLVQRGHNYKGRRRFGRAVKNALLDLSWAF